jgi:hypothetical protein
MIQSTTTREITEQSRNVHQIREQYNSANSEFWYLLSSDAHWDNPDSNRDMMERHLKECQKRGALWFHFGDFFCAMQGKYDKRSDKSKIRPEHQTGKYLDSLVNTAAEWLMPYRDVISVIGQGNHETSIQQRHETNLIERLVEKLNPKGVDHLVHMGGYGGWLKMIFEHTSKGARKSLNIKYFHGHGGGGPVTKGVIQSQRQAVMFPDADIVVSGHVHENYTISYGRERLTDQGRIKIEDQWHLRTPTYKDEYKDGYGGWHIETGKPPKPIGAYWLKVDVSSTSIHFDFLKAK